MVPRLRTCQTLSRGSARSSQRGSHQTRSPISSISAGSRTMRTTVASRITATVSPTPSWLTVAIGVAGEGDEDRHHDRRGAGDHPRRLLEAELDRGGVVPLAVVVLAHAHEQEDRVVDREPEDDAEDHRRPDRVDVGVAAQRPAVGDVGEQGEDAEGDADRGQVEADRDRRQRQRPQDEDRGRGRWRA